MVLVRTEVDLQGVIAAGTDEVGVGEVEVGGGVDVAVFEFDTEGLDAFSVLPAGVGGFGSIFVIFSPDS